jgi:hypothetical protein
LLMKIIKLNYPACHALDFNPETLAFRSSHVVYLTLSLVPFRFRFKFKSS